MRIIAGATPESFLNAAATVCCTMESAAGHLVS
jgi:hypothetical protein